MLGRTDLCKHEFGCYENTLRGWYKSFLTGLAVKSVLNLLPCIINPKKLVATLFSLKDNLDSVRFALFLACMNAAYKAVLCLLRRYYQDDKVNAFIAGFVSAFPLLIDEKNRRKFIALIFFARSLECLFNAMEKHGIRCKIPYGEQLVFSIAGCFNKYSMAYEQELLNPGLRKFYENASLMSKNDKILIECWHKMLQNQMKK